MVCFINNVIASYDKKPNFLLLQKNFIPIYFTARLQTNYDEQVMSPPIAPIPRSPAPRSPAPSVSDSDCEIVAVVKKENTSGQPKNQNTAAHQVNAHNRRE